MFIVASGLIRAVFCNFIHSKKQNAPFGAFHKLNYSANGSRKIMVSTRSGPVERISTGTPNTSSIRLI